MNIAKIVISLLLVAIFGLSMSFYFFESEPPEISDRAYHISYIRGLVAEKLAERYDMEVVSLRTNMREKVNLIFIGFKVDRVLTQDEAREMILDSVDVFVDEVNNYPEVHQYLQQVPFTREDVALFFNLGNGRVTHPDLRYVGYHHDQLYYKTIDYNVSDDFVTVSRESYNEAIKKLER